MHGFGHGRRRVRSLRSAVHRDDRTTRGRSSRGAWDRDTRGRSACGRSFGVMSASSGAAVRDRLLDSGMPHRIHPRTDATVVELVVAAQAGDRLAFTQLYSRFHKVVHALVLARVSARDAGDVVQ